MTASAGRGILEVREGSESTFAHELLPSHTYALSAADEAAFVSSEVPVQVLRGRPRGVESAARERELVRLLAGGASLHAAVKESRVKPERVLRLLGDPAFRSAVVQLLEQAEERAA